MVFTVALASWWLIFGLSQARHLGALEGPDAAQVGRVTRMLVFEGVMLVGMLMAGGVALLVAIRREQRRRRDLRAFFMAFTHDLKTSLTSLRLQAEALREDLPQAAANPNLQRLLKDSVRLQLQFENALALTTADGAVFIEAIDVRPLIDYLRDDFPELTIDLTGDARVRADRRALESVLRNLLQNAVVHGRAHASRSIFGDRPPGAIEIVVTDDGSGATVDLAPRSIVRSCGQPRPADRASACTCAAACCTRCRGRSACSAADLQGSRSASSCRRRSDVARAARRRRSFARQDARRTAGDRRPRRRVGGDLRRSGGGGAPSTWDLAIVDVMLPDGSGFDLAPEIRGRSYTPIMFMTALNSAESRLTGFELGADEYLPKPFHLKEFLLRVRHVLTTQPPRRQLKVGNVTVDWDAMAIDRPGDEREFLQVRDYRVLAMLVEAAPRALSRSEILDRVWGEQEFPTQRTVDNAIVRLRQALGDIEGQLIRSVRGIGYQWAASSK